MKIREIIPLLSSNPLFSKTPQSSQKPSSSFTSENNELSFTAKNFLSVNNQSSEIYYYSPIECKLYVIKVESTLDNTICAIRFQELKLKINFEVYKIELNEDSRYLCISGHVNCIIVDLNPQTLNSYFTSQEIFSDQENKTFGYDSLTVRSFTLDKTFYQSQISNIIKQVEWHPLSNIHLVILYSNNTLKIYNIQSGNEEIEQTFNLESIHTFESLKNLKNNDIRNQTKNTKKFISFCFGSNINFWTRFTIFLLSDSGEIFNLCPVIPNNCLVETSFYRDFQNHILYEKNQIEKNRHENNSNGDDSDEFIKQQQQQKKYYDFQFKWLMAASINTIPFEIENVSWLKLSSPSNGSTTFNPLLQGPISRISDSLPPSSNRVPLKILSIQPLVSNIDQNSNSSIINKINNNNNNDDDNDNNDNNDDDDEKKKHNLSLSSTNKLIPFVIIVLMESCESLVNICCQDTIPMWSNDNGILYLEENNSNSNSKKQQQQQQQQPKYIDLILYEILDLNVKKSIKPSFSNIDKNLKNKSTIATMNQTKDYLSYSLPTMKYDQWSDSLYFYHNQGVQIAKFPWLYQIYLEINNIVAFENNNNNNNNSSTAINSTTTTTTTNNNKNKNDEIDENIEFETTSLMSVINNGSGNGDQCIPIIGIQVFSNIKIGTYFLILPNTFKIIIFDMDGLINQQPNLHEQKQQKQQQQKNENDDDEDNSDDDEDEINLKSPIQPFIDNPPSFIGRIILPNSFTQKEFLQTLVNTKKKLYNLYIYSNQLEIELNSRVKGLELISKDQLKLIDKLKIYIENLKSNQQALNAKLKYVWDKKEIDSEEIKELYKVEMEGKPLSNQEKELAKTLKQINSQVNIYSERLNQVEKDLQENNNNNNNNNNSSNINNNNNNDNGLISVTSYETIPIEHQTEIKKVLNLHGQKIEEDVTKLEKLLKNIQI
ncbi:hypothetical protein ACTFIW_006440 [Dictyostelium discoideum]